MGGFQCVTGAFGYSGSYLAERLLAAGHEVHTLTNSPGREHPLRGRVTVHSLDFSNREQLTWSLRGCDVLYNTYWVRFNHRGFTFADAVANTETLFAAAEAAGVRRVVHTSITNPSEDSPFEYFRGKARLEAALRATNLSWAILRPAVLFGGAGLLVNNIAWALRHLPVFEVFGDGQYRLQPIHVEDFADLAVAQGAAAELAVIDAIGPETFTYAGLVDTLGRIIGCRRPVLGVPPWLGYALTTMLGWYLRDVILTWEEVGGLMADLLVTNSPPVGTRKLTDWATEHADVLGRRYWSELARRHDRHAGYDTDAVPSPPNPPNQPGA